MSLHEADVPQSDLTPVPRIEDLGIAERGYDRDAVKQAFADFRRLLTWHQAQLRVLQSAPRGASPQSTGHDIRMDALHLIRAAADFADALERDAQTAAARQMERAAAEIREAKARLEENEQELDRHQRGVERQAAEALAQARTEAHEIVARAKREAGQELGEANAAAARLLEQARHQATELTNAARVEIERAMEWARAHSDATRQRAQAGAEQLLAATGQSEETIRAVADAIAHSADATSEARRPAAPEEHAPPADAPASPPSGDPDVENSESGPREDP